LNQSDAVILGVLTKGACELVHTTQFLFNHLGRRGDALTERRRTRRVSAEDATRAEPHSTEVARGRLPAAAAADGLIQRVIHFSGGKRSEPIERRVEADDLADDDDRGGLDPGRSGRNFAQC